MKLNVIIPTYNRAKLLLATLQSVGSARIPVGLEIEVIVVDNNSDDDTAETIKTWNPPSDRMKAKYLFEPQQGRSYAVNAGIKQVNAELVAMIDDDIQISEDWFSQIFEVFSNRWNEVDFIGGKVLPIWEIEPPDWVKKIKNVGICWRDYGDSEWSYSDSTPILTGGHAILKSEIFQEIGVYPEELGVKKKNLISCEDDVMFDKLLAAGRHGIYVPTLIVNHYVTGQRLTRNFYRHWNFGAGMSWDLVEKNHKPFTGRKLLNVPAYLYKNALKGLSRKIEGVVTFDQVKSIESEKDIMIFLGYFYSGNLLNSWLDEPLKLLVGKVFASAGR